MSDISWNGQGVDLGKIICVGRNYVAHIEELGNEVPDNMVLFMKPASAVSDTLYCSHDGGDVHFEAELCFIVKNQKLAGVGFGLDLTKREVQSALKAKGLPWERAKAFAGSVVFSDFVDVPDDLTTLSFDLCVDGVQVQFGDSALMMYKPGEILAEVAGVFGLEDGDIIMTGTPKGVGALRPHARYTGRVQIDGKTVCEASWVGASTPSDRTHFDRAD